MRKTEQRDRKESRELKGEEERRRLQFLADVTAARLENLPARDSGFSTDPRVDTEIAVAKTGSTASRNYGNFPQREIDVIQIGEVEMSGNERVDRGHQEPGAVLARVLGFFYDSALRWPQCQCGRRAAARRPVLVSTAVLNYHHASSYAHPRVRRPRPVPFRS